MIWAILITCAIFITAASLDDAFNGFEDEDDDVVEEKKAKEAK